MDSPYGPNYEILGFKSQKILEKYELKSSYSLLGSTDSLHGPIYEDFVVDILRFRNLHHSLRVQCIVSCCVCFSWSVSSVQSSKEDRVKLLSSNESRELRTEQTLQILRKIDPTREALWKVEKINEWQ